MVFLSVYDIYIKCDVKCEEWYPKVTIFFDNSHNKLIYIFCNRITRSS